MPFVQLVGDQPVHTLILEIKNKNLVLFEKILLFLVELYTACDFLSVIYWRFKGSGLEDLAVEAGMIEPSPVDNAIKGGHYKRGIRIHNLIYESLVRILIEQWESSLLSRSIKAKLQNSFNFKKVFDDEKIAKKVNGLMPSYFNNINMESPMVYLVVVSRDGGNPLLALSFNARSKPGRAPTFNETNDAMDVSIW